MAKAYLEHRRKPRTITTSSAITNDGYTETTDPNVTTAEYVLSSLPVGTQPTEANLLTGINGL